MWLFQFLPAWVTHLILAIGIIGTIAGFVLGMIPFVKQYRIPIQIISILVLAFGLYLEGGIANEEKWQARVKELEAKVATAEAKSQEVVTQVVTKYVTRTQVIKERGDTVIQYVDREVVKYDNKCEIPTVVIKAHDAAAKNQPMPVDTQPAEQPKTTEDTKKEPVIQTQEVNAAASNMRLPKRENK